MFFISIAFSFIKEIILSSNYSHMTLGLKEPREDFIVSLPGGKITLKSGQNTCVLLVKKNSLVNFPQLRFENKTPKGKSTDTILTNTTNSKSNNNLIEKTQSLLELGYFPGLSFLKTKPCLHINQDPERQNYFNVIHALTGSSQVPENVDVIFSPGFFYENSPEEKITVAKLAKMKINTTRSN